MPIETNIKFSIVVPLFNEAESIPFLFERLHTLQEKLAPIQLELIIVDDHSTDGTLKLLEAHSAQNDHVKVIRLARNAGSHVALCAGLQHASGDCILFLAGDLQDPPELVLEMLEKWQEGYKIVWAARSAEPGRKIKDVIFSRLYWAMVRCFTDTHLPLRGVDFALVDRQVLEIIRPQLNRHVPAYLLMAETGLASTVIYFSKALRAHGKSGWNLSRQWTVIIGSFTVFSDVPFRFISLTGLTTIVFGLLVAAFVILQSRVYADSISGWALVIGVMMVLGGIQITILGILGEYFYMMLKEIRNPPRYIIEQMINFPTETSTDERHLLSIAKVR